MFNWTKRFNITVQETFHYLQNLQNIGNKVKHLQFTGSTMIILAMLRVKKNDYNNTVQTIITF